MGTQAVEVTRSGVGFTIDVTAADLSEDLLVKDFQVFHDGNLVSNILYEKTSPILVTYTGASLPSTEVRVRRKTPNSVIQVINFGDRFSSTLWNAELDRQIRWREEADAFGVGELSLVDSTLPKDDPFDASWNGDITSSVSRNALYDKFVLVDNNADSLQTQINNNDTDITSLQSQITSNDSDITSLQSQINSNDSDISGLQSQITSNDGDITTLQGQTSSNATSISTNATNISSNLTSINSINTFLNGTRNFDDNEINFINLNLGNFSAGVSRDLDRALNSSGSCIVFGSTSGGSVGAGVVSSFIFFYAREGSSVQGRTILSHAELVPQVSGSNNPRIRNNGAVTVDSCYVTAFFFD